MNRQKRYSMYGKGVYRRAKDFVDTQHRLDLMELEDKHSLPTLEGTVGQMSFARDIRYRRFLECESADERKEYVGTVRALKSAGALLDRYAVVDDEKPKDCSQGTMRKPLRMGKEQPRTTLRVEESGPNNASEDSDLQTTIGNWAF